MNDRKESTLRTGLGATVRRFLIVFLPLAALVGIVLALFYYADLRTAREIVKGKEIKSIDRGVNTIGDDLSSVVSDLLILSEQHELQRVLEGDEEERRTELADLDSNFLSFSLRRRIYDQIRFLDETGMEVVRVNYNDGKPIIIPESQLQSKAERYYFTDTIVLAPGEVYMSPFDLNIERGEIEKPLKPMIRFATPVFGSSGEKRGIVILNYLGANIIRGLERVSATTESQFMLLNPDGFYLKGLRPEDEWGFMYEDRENRTFGDDFGEAWQRISAEEAGQFQTLDGIFTFRTVHFLLTGQGLDGRRDKALQPSVARPQAEEYYLKLVSRMPPYTLKDIFGKLLTQLLPIYTLIVALLAFASWFVARASVERKRMEIELRIKEEAIASSVNAIILADLKGNLNYVNHSFLHMWGYSDEKEVLGRPVAELWKTKDGASEALEAVQSSRSWMGELVARRKDDSVFDVQLLANMVENEAGKAICMMASVIDITERKKIEQMKSDFVALASHELRTPLTSIQGYAELILDGDVGKISREQREFLEIISQNTRRLEALINDVLDVEKIESGRMTMKMEKTDLIQVVDNCFKTFKVMAEGKGLQLEKDIKTSPINVLGDSDRLSQVFSNLLSNAIKYSKEGRVKISASIKGEFASVAVEDTGLGMSPEDMKIVFSRFFRAEDSYVRKTTGSGLGLSIVKATIERHNGDIKVESKLGAGSKFEVILPLFKEKEGTGQ